MMRLILIPRTPTVYLKIFETYTCTALHQNLSAIPLCIGVLNLNNLKSLTYKHTRTVPDPTFSRSFKFHFPPYFYIPLFPPFFHVFFRGEFHRVHIPGRFKRLKPSCLQSACNQTQSLTLRKGFTSF
jgi:hypothetical protein